MIKHIAPDYIIHLAAQVSVAVSVQHFVYDEEVNIKGSLHVIKAAAEAGVEKVVFASSAAVYGDPVYLPVDTAHPLQPGSPYGLSKLTVERYLQMAKSLYDVDYCIMRYSNVYGPRQDALGEGGVVSIFSDKFAKQQGTFHLWKRGTNKRFHLCRRSSRSECCSFNSSIKRLFKYLMWSFHHGE